MPSNSRKLFKSKLLPDVGALLESHRVLNPTGRGRRALGHITRSGVVMLCAAWELYIEEVAKEAADHIAARARTPDDLPLRLRQKISRVVRNHKNEVAPLLLCGDGWRNVYKNRVKQLSENLNTPKFGNIDELFSKCLDLSGVNLSWRHDKSDLNAFVSIRGEIAHRGADARYVKVKDLREYKNVIDDLVKDTDDAISAHIRDITSVGTLPWRRT
ncbi:MAE_28990/MAE_18760 family HEPN-like nuclease [Aquicoccus sp. SU-CL01552]|uniref:MAE_28990/MAE_18760 family HEPN-like nuclease n=1 Tax=Aquicoccus sp. SU-CL01552 TaxID=3127656 RepID=UPI003107535C